MSDDNNVVVETTEEVQKTERAKALKRRSSIGRFLDGVKSLLGFSTGDNLDNDSVEETEVKEEQDVEPEDQMDVEVAEDVDPEVDSIGDAEEDDFLDEGEEVKPDPKLQAIKKMNLTKKEKVALAKQRSEELLEEAIKRASQEEESRSASPERKTAKRGPGRPKKTQRKKAAAKTPSKATTKKVAKSSARSRSPSPSSSDYSTSRSASPVRKTPAKKAATKTTKKTPAKVKSPSRSRSASPAKKTTKTPAKSPAKSPKTPRATRKTPAKKAAATKATPRTVGRKRKADDPAEGESPTKKVKVDRRKSAPAKKSEANLPDVTVTWPKNVLRQTYKGGKTFYSSVTVNDKKFSVGDTIYLISETSPDPYIGIIESLYETKTGRNRAELQWYYKHEETNSTAKPTKGEVYQSDHIDANPIESFVLDRTPVVMHESEIKDLSSYLTKPDHYYYNRFYDHEAKKFHNAKKDK
eukprot:TRINITY_DN4251_c0_g1_i1.p1 TRINITY_DN4251_c0_g1~~TRINITY_DN4251_c0_g1_i1.p1  ORF type:complete len:474 (+),score=162.51 TRINITY_DN4251_c0_g1_i1:24-1424(+)